MAKQLGLDTEAGADVDLTQFADADEIDADAEDAVRWAYASDLLTEKDGKLHVQEELRRCKYVKSFRLGVYGEGESGVTIVEFK